MGLGVGGFVGLGQKAGLELQVGGFVGLDVG